MFIFINQCLKTLFELFTKGGGVLNKLFVLKDLDCGQSRSARKGRTAERTGMFSRLENISQLFVCDKGSYWIAVSQRFGQGKRVWFNIIGLEPKPVTGSAHTALDLVT